MSPKDAESILSDDADPEVRDRYPAPQLADTSSRDVGTLRWLADEVGASMHDAELLDELVEAWHDGVNQVWDDVLACTAHQTLHAFHNEASVVHDNAADSASHRVTETIEQLEHAAAEHPWAPKHH